MNTRNTLIASSLIVASLASGAAHAALQGRDLDGNAATFEAYYDTDLNITWLADTNYAKTSGYDVDGLMNFEQANTWAANLSFTDGVHVYNNWRLPTVGPVNAYVTDPFDTKDGFDYAFSTNGSTDIGYNISAPGSTFAGSTASEMAHLFYSTLGNPGYYTPAGVLSGCYTSSSDTCLDNTGPFSNVQEDVYWSGSDYEYPLYGWFFGTFDGYQDAYPKNYDLYAWAVSTGDVAAVPEADTWAMMLAGLGLVSVVTRRRRG